MGAGIDTAAFTQVRIDPSALGSVGQHLAVNALSGVWVLTEDSRVEQEVVIPRYSGRNPYLSGLVIVIGPVDCVDNSCPCWWGRLCDCARQVDKPGQHRGRPVHERRLSTGGLRRRRGYPLLSGRYAHLVPVGSTGRCTRVQNKRPQSYPQAVDEMDVQRVNGWSRTGHKATGLFTSLWTTLWA